MTENRLVNDRVGTTFYCFGVELPLFLWREREREREVQARAIAVDTFAVEVWREWESTSLGGDHYTLSQFRGRMHSACSFFWK